MRNRFDKQLDKLNEELTKMGALCESAIASTVTAMMHFDRGLAGKTIETDSQIDNMEKEIEQLCLTLLLRQQPVASDLRLISSALKMITDMERIGDQAADIAEIAMYSDLSGSDMADEISSQAREVIHMVNESVDAYVSGDLTMAQSVIEYDDRVDALFMKIRKDVIDRIAAGDCDAVQLVDILMIAKYLERIGDHATNIAEWVEFSITGQHRSSPSDHF